MASPYDKQTAERLKACHGVERAAAIVAGLDGPTNADIERWRKLGGDKPQHNPTADPLTPELRAKVEDAFRRIK